jgi:hypothetical protein
MTTSGGFFALRQFQNFQKQWPLEICKCIVYTDTWRKMNKKIRFQAEALIVNSSTGLLPVCKRTTTGGI